MRRIPVDTYEHAWQELQRLKANASGPPQIYKIVKSPYSGYEVVAIGSDLYVDMLTDDLLSGLPLFRRVGVGGAWPFGS